MFFFQALLIIITAGILTTVLVLKNHHRPPGANTASSRSAGSFGVTDRQLVPELVLPGLLQRVLDGLANCGNNYTTAEVVQIVCRRQDSGCASSEHAPSDIAVMSTAGITLHHCVQGTEQLMDHGFKWTRCSGSFRTISKQGSLCPEGELDDEELKTAADCLNAEFSNPLGSASTERCGSGLRLCASSTTLPLLEQLCIYLEGSIPLADEASIRRREIYMPAHMRRTNEEAITMLNGTWWKDMDFAKCMKKYPHLPRTWEEERSMYIHCLEVTDREQTMIIVVIVVVGLMLVIAIIGIGFRWGMNRRSRKQAQEHAQAWQAHRNSLQEANRNLFTDAIIPEEPEDECEGRSAHSDQANTPGPSPGAPWDCRNSDGAASSKGSAPWYRRLQFWRRGGARSGNDGDPERQGTTTADAAPQQPAQPKVQPQFDGAPDRLFIMPPAPPRRVYSRNTASRLPRHKATAALASGLPHGRKEAALTTAVARAPPQQDGSGVRNTSNGSKKRLQQDEVSEEHASAEGQHDE